MNQKIKLSVVAMSTLIFASLACGNENLPKHSLKGNYQVSYNKTPSSVDSFTDMFKEGMFYGRLRSNTFYYGWEKETATQDSHLISGLGGSLIYKTATFAGFDFTAGMYYSQGFFDDTKDPAARLKSGKDVISRHDFTNGGSKSMAVVGQAYIGYKGIPKTEVRVGRQIVDTFYTASNDSKMIPNTFDGVVVQTKALSGTDIKLAYLSEQKLRDHTDSHAVLMYGDSASSSSTNPSWTQNDDSAMHKGLTYTRLKAAGKPTDAPLITGDLSNKSIENLKLDASFYSVPELVSEAMAEANYKVKVGALSITPGARYIKQFDNGAGKVGGAAYSGTLAGQSGASGGYKKADSLESQMVGARLVADYGVFKLNLGYTQVMDEADLIAPWRGFPTGGYTRSMARFNWVANTKSYRAELSVNSNKTGVYKDLFMQLSVLHMDADESKGQFDENYYYLGFIQNFPFMQDLQWRLRLGYADTKKVNADSLDGRFEVNYLF
ncbi:OprD family porin [bacterium]|nr:OprD family porin [bacterium]MBU1882871.1 OprD family porin [bacterium]